MGNPRWAREEMILAADLARKNKWKGVRTTTLEVRELSQILQGADIHPSAHRNESFKSINSVSLKVNNLITSHPQFIGVGLRSTTAEKAVIREFIDDPARMTDPAAIIRNRLKATFAETKTHS